MTFAAQDKILSGICDARFARVRESLKELFHTQQEVGCALAVYCDGRPVVDLWGGLADPVRGLPCHRDTIVLTGKLVIICTWKYGVSSGATSRGLQLDTLCPGASANVGIIIIRISVGRPCR